MKYIHLKDSDILLIDYSGKINLENGISNMNLIEKKFREFSLNRTCIKIIFDVKNTIWESLETKYALSKIAHEKFSSKNLGFVIYAALLNNEHNFLSFENQHFFIEKEDAINWLKQK